MLANLDTLTMLNVSEHLTSAATLKHKNDNRLPLVLVIDDDVDSLVLMCHVLEKFACTPLCETNGQAALDAIDRYKVDLIILDIRLPEVCGLEIMRSLKRHDVTRTVPIVVVTALATQKDRQEVLCVGCDHYITKPYLLQNMERIMNSYLLCKP